MKGPAARASALITTDNRSAGLTATVCLRGRYAPEPFSRCIHIPCRWSGCSIIVSLTNVSRRRSP